MGLTSRLQRQPGSNVPFMNVAAPALPTTAWPCALNGRFSPSRARLLMKTCVMPPPLPVARAPDASGRRDPDTAVGVTASGRNGPFGALAGVRGDDALESGAHPGGKPFVALRAGDDVPPLLREHLQRERVTLGDVLAEREALPFAEVDLAQVRLDARLDAEALCERRCR